LQIAAFDALSASPADLDACFRLYQAAAADRPAEPAPVRSAYLARITRAPTPGRRYLDWLARSATTGELTGIASLMLLGDQPSDLAAIDITVHPGYRRRGIGSTLLTDLAGAASGRRSLLIEGLTEGSPGQAWAAAHGFTVAQRTIVLAIDMTSVDRTRWCVPAPSGYQLAHWTGSAPDDLLKSYAAARNAIAEAPHGKLTFTEPEWTPLRVRAAEAAARSRRCELWVIAAVHELSARVVGVTYLEVDQHSPELAVQQDTAVLRAHRGHGIGAWMKAANLQLLAARRPQVRQVRTSNAADNEHMLRVNRQVGLVAAMAMENRQASVTDLAFRLGQAGGRG
jgi:mycothiol synthase